MLYLAALALNAVALSLWYQIHQFDPLIYSGRGKISAEAVLPKKPRWLLARPALGLNHTIHTPSPMPLINPAPHPHSVHTLCHLTGPDPLTVQMMTASDITSERPPNTVATLTAVCISSSSLDTGLTVLLNVTPSSRADTTPMVVQKDCMSTDERV
jgi:hypothetical protein